MAKKNVVRSFVNICSITFKTFDFNVVISSGKTTLWNFVTFKEPTDKHYAIMCSPDLTKVKSIIKIALKKVPSNHRLVVVTTEYKEEDLAAAASGDYCLITLDELKQYGDQMLEIRGRENNNAFVDKAIK